MWNELFAHAAPPPPQFDKSVELALRITIEGHELLVPGDHIEELSLDLRAYGYAGFVRFCVFDDKSAGGDWKDSLHDGLIGHSLIEIELRVRAYFEERERRGDSIRSLSVQALVGERTLREARDAKHSGRRHRVYTLHFYDPAYLLWRTHFPTELYTKKSLTQVLLANKPRPILLNITSQKAAAVQPLLFLGHSPEENGSASFYDFVIWCADTQNLIFYYDYIKREYVLADAKPEPGRPIPLDHGDVAGIEQLFAEVPRTKPRVHNVCVAAAQTQTADNAKALAPLFQDHLLRVKVAQEVEARRTLLGKRLSLPKPGFALLFGRLPVRMLMPGDFIDLTQDAQWKQAGVNLPQVAQDEPGRIRRVVLSLRNRSDVTVPRAKDSLGLFHGSLRAEVEAKSLAAPLLPKYVTPTYPRLCEGKILVDQGADNEEVYQIVTDLETSAETYRIAVPTWENQEIAAPFDTHQQPGHFYFPAYKHQTVLVALYFDRARIAGFVDWRSAGARVPKETQGNHLLFGKTIENNTSVRHIYEDNKPVFSIHRTHQKDHQMIEIREGYLLIQVKEEAEKGA